MEDNREIYTEEQGKHLMDYVLVVLRRRLIFAVVFAIIFLGTVFSTLSMKRVYEASTTLLIRDDRMAGKADFMEGVRYSNPLDTNIEILKSRSMAEVVAKRFRLNMSISDKTPELDVKLLDFLPAEEKSSYVVDITGPDSYIVRNKAGLVVGKGRSGALMMGEGVSIFLNIIHGKQGDSLKIVYKPQKIAVGEIIGGTKVVEVGRRTNIIRLSYMSGSPALARDVANMLAEVFIDNSVESRTAEASKALNFIEEQLASVREELGQAEKSMQSFKANSGVIQLDAGAQKLLQNLSDVEKSKRDLGLQRKQMEYSLAAFKDALKQGKTGLSGTEPPGVSTLVAKLAELEAQRRTQFGELTDKHPAVLLLQTQISDVRQRIADVYENTLKSMAKQEANLSQVREGYERELRGMPQLEQEMIRRMRDSKVSSDIYMFLLQKHEETKISKASAISNIRIVDPAVLPGVPVKPNKPRNIIFGFVAALGFGLVVVFFIDYLDDTIKDAETAKREFGTSLLAIIPFILPDEESHGKKWDKTQALITHLAPKAQASEAFRTLRTALHFSAVKRQRQIIMVSSSFPGEGKSTIVANLAVTLAHTGAKVVLLDCDLRRPSIHEIFAFTKTPGLSEVLAGDAEIDTVIRPTPVEGLSVICAGTIPPNPSELLGSEQMAKVLEGMKGKYDYVLLDAPPVLAVTDAPLLTASAHMVLLVVEGGKVPVKAAQRVREVLHDLKAPLAGLVLNDKSSSSTKGYYGYYRYGYYRYGYYRYGYYYTPEYYGDDEKRKKKHKAPWWKKLLKR